MATIISTKTSGVGGLEVTGDASGVLQLASNNGTTAITVDASQNVGINATDMSSGGKNAKLAVAGNINLDDDNFIAWGGGTGRPTFAGNKASNYMYWSTSGTERMRIASNGSVNIGAVAQNTASRLQISGESSTSATNSLSCVNSSGTGQLFLRNDNYFNSGAIANYSVAGTALVIDGSNYVGKTTSSLRYKKDIVNYDKGLEAIAKLRPVYYKSAVEGPDGIDPKQHAGFIAEEIAEEGFEEFLIRNQDGEPDAIQYAQMTAILCKAIQELKAIIDTQAERIAVLENK